MKQTVNVSSAYKTFVLLLVQAVKLCAQGLAS